MTITGQDYEKTADIRIGNHGVYASFKDVADVWVTVAFDPEGAIKVAHALIEAAEKIIKK